MRLACPFLSGCFNTQPPEGGCPDYPDEIVDGEVSTHSRLKAAGFA